MKLALFSDVHANLPALAACLGAIETQEPDVIYCLGDLVGYNVWPNEVIREVKQRNIPTIAGNYDQGIGMHSNECGCAYKTEEDREMGKISISYTNEVIGEKERAFLRSLPAHIRIDFQHTDQKVSILLVHGSPRKINEYLFEDREEKSLLRIVQDAQADILCFGHTHKPFHRILASNHRYYHAINTGSVGKPKDGTPEGCFVVLTLNENLNAGDKELVKVDFIRFDYDYDAAASAIEASPLPNAYADMLRKGY